MSNIISTIVADAKLVARKGLAAGIGAAGAFLTANATGVADDIVAGDVAGLEHLGVGLSVAVGVAAWHAAERTLARIFGGGDTS